jgi:hypothetical protein
MFLQVSHAGLCPFLAGSNADWFFSCRQARPGHFHTRTILQFFSAANPTNARLADAEAFHACRYPPEQKKDPFEQTK